MKKKAIIIMNMGAICSNEDIKIFLTNMFNDKNIIKAPSFIRKLIAKYILYKRVDEVKENYSKIGGKSPLYDITNDLIYKLQQALSSLNKEKYEYYITSSMRYTAPFAKDTLQELKDRNIRDITLFPLYPHYSTTTVKSSLEEFLDVINPYHFQVEIIKPFYKNKKYNLAILEQIKEAMNQDENYHLIFSAHSLPVKIIKAGDSYKDEVEEHINILKELFTQNNLKFKSISLAYQSKIGPVKWLEPSLDKELENFQNKKVLIYPISFIIDNSETVFELDIEYRELAEKYNLKEYKVIKALNSNDNFIDVMVNLIDDK